MRTFLLYEFLGATITNHHTWVGLKQETFIFSVLEASCSKSRCQQGCVAYEGSREESLLTSAGADGSRHSLAYRCRIPIAASIFSWP